MSCGAARTYPTLEEHFLFRGEMERLPRAVLPFHRVVFQKITDWMLGTLPDGKKHLALCLPPGHGKTFIAHDAVTYGLGLFPDSQWIYTGYSKPLAAEQTARIREIVSSGWFRRVYPWTLVKRGSSRKDMFHTTRGGFVYGAGTGGTITGFRAGKKRPGFGGGIVVDDPIKPKGAQSATVRNGVNRWFTQTLLSRRNRDETPILLVMQRLHPEDLAAHAAKTMPGEWETCGVAAYDETAKRTIWPETFSPRTAELLKAADPATFYAQYQQSPQAPGGNIVKRGWWRHYAPGSVSLLSGAVFITADTAFKEKSSADASVLRAWLGTYENLYCLDADWGRWEFPELLRRAKAFWAKWRAKGCRAFLVEDKASGGPLAASLADAGVPALAWKPSDHNFPESKAGRVKKASWFVYGGRVFLPEGEEHSEILMEEAGAFAADMSHAHDDHVDALVMAVAEWSHNGGAADLARAMEQAGAD